MEQTDRIITFSVIIPVFNGAATICRAIDSVRLQSYQPLEIIVVDDASTDKTIPLIRSTYGDTITLLQNEANVGGSDTRNVGMSAAKGAYIAFLDADDSWHVRKLELISTVLITRPNDALVYHNYTLSNLNELNIPATVVPVNATFAGLLPGNDIAPSCAVIRNDATFRFSQGMRYTEDYDLWLRILYGRSAAFIPVPLTQIYRRFTTSGGVSGNRWLMRRGELTAYGRLPRLNPFFIFLVPLLWCYSLLKHLRKLISS